MFKIFLMRTIGQCVLAAACLTGGHAMAQSEPSPAEVYGAVQAGKLEQAQVMVQQVLIAHPNSAKAYYVCSEVFARQGDLKHAREALASAEKLAPGLPFAKTDAVQALRSQLSAGGARPDASGSVLRPTAPPGAATTASGGLPLVLAGGVLTAGYFLFRRRPPQVGAPQAATETDGGLGAPEALGVGGGTGVMPAGFAQAPASSMGGRIMGGVATGLAVGAGVIAAEAIGRGLMGRHDAAPGASAVADNTFAGNDARNDARLDRSEGRRFYGVIAAATVGGVILCFTPMDPVKELFWSAVLNGVIAMPIMVVMMLIASRTATMGANVIGPRLRLLGWLATAAMAATVIAMLITSWA